MSAAARAAATESRRLRLVTAPAVPAAREEAMSRARAARRQLQGRPAPSRRDDRFAYLRRTFD